MPKFFDLCCDDVAQVREQVSTQTTAAIIKNLLKSDKYLSTFIDRMKEMKNSLYYCHRQAFAGMIESMLVDSCTLHDNAEDQVDLVTLVINKYFVEDLLDLSKDRVSNVRISLAEAFNKMSKRYEHLEIEQQSRKLSIAKKQQIQEIKFNIVRHLNRRLFKVV